jgi:hypothetical protein
MGCASLVLWVENRKAPLILLRFSAVLLVLVLRFAVLIGVLIPVPVDYT